MKKIFDEALKDQTLPPTDWSFLRLALVPRAPASQPLKGQCCPSAGTWTSLPSARTALPDCPPHPTIPRLPKSSPSSDITVVFTSSRKLFWRPCRLLPSPLCLLHRTCCGTSAHACDCLHRRPSSPLDVKVHEGRNAGFAHPRIISTLQARHTVATQ